MAELINLTPEWEYMSESPVSMDRMNELGAEGWEMIWYNAFFDQRECTMKKIAIFKRVRYEQLEIHEPPKEPRPEFDARAAEPQPEPTQEANSRLLDEDIYQALRRLGILDTSVRAYNRGASDYSQHLIQPWAIWQEYNLNPWDADIVKRILRTKQGDSRRLDYEKIIHICEERIRQIDMEDQQCGQKA